MSYALEALIEAGRAVPLEREIERRGIKLQGRVARCGPCPRCGGVDRFAINSRKGTWNCRQCKPKEIKGDVIGLVQWLDRSDFAAAVRTLAGDPISHSSST